MSDHATAASSGQYAAPAWAVQLRRFNDWWMYELGSGPKAIKFSWVINTQKAGTFLFLGALMWFYAEHNPAATSANAWIYLALHGSYGVIWLIKDLAFPDPNWQRRITWPSALMTGSILAGYWSFGWLLISGTSKPSYALPEPVWFCLCISLCLIGCVLMIAADAQKFFTLRIQRGLITDGLHRYIRHPNYLGEMLVYGSFALLVDHWFPWALLAYVWLGVFAVNMAMKEASMSRYPQWTDYKARSAWLVPGVF